MASIESMNELKETPEVLLKYEKWWTDTYGREITPEEYKQLIGFTRELAQTDEKFKAILSDSLTGEFLDSEDGLEEQKHRKWVMITALSTYGKEFDLKID